MAEHTLTPSRPIARPIAERDLVGGTPAFDPATATIAVVTYNRSGLLTLLLESLVAMHPKPGHVVIIDNASTDDTTAVVESFRERLGTTLVYRRLETNTGGSGGFSEGMRVAYELGSTWIWLMDDDVEVVPDGLAKMGAWAPRFKSIQGRRYDYDGSAFYWQYRIADSLAIPIPFAPSEFDSSGFKPMNSGCFEGMFIHRDIVAQIGLPDPRFFIYWDDQVYGWLASRKTPAAIVNEFVLRRTREIKQWDMGIRHMNASSDAYRFYIMRNRAYIKKYYRSLGVYRRVPFALGTTLTFGKEVIRLLVVERKVHGFSHLFRGLREGRRISRDASWRPMPPLEPTPTAGSESPTSASPDSGVDTARG